MTPLVLCHTMSSCLERSLTVVLPCSPLSMCSAGASVRGFAPAWHMAGRVGWHLWVSCAGPEVGRHLAHTQFQVMRVHI